MLKHVKNIGSHVVNGTKKATNHVKNHTKKVANHVKKHHRKYLLFGGIASGVFLVVKLIMFFSASYMLYNITRDASFADDSVLIDQIDSETDIEGEEDIAEDIEEVIEEVIEEDIIEDVMEEDLEGEEILTTTEICNSSGFSTNIIDDGAYSGEINISWEISDSCNDETIILQLYDHNNQWLPIVMLGGGDFNYVFDSNLLLTGFYTHTEIVDGEEVIILEGMYPGYSTGYWTGYRLKRTTLDDSIIFETNEFTIDNIMPEIFDINVSFFGVMSGVVGVNNYITLDFVSSESLTGVSVLFGTGEAILYNLSGNNYTYNYLLTEEDNLGYIDYTIFYYDFAINGGVLTGTSDLFYDPQYPHLTGFNLSGNKFSFATSKPTYHSSFLVLKNTTNGWSFSTTGVSTSHEFVLPSLAISTQYDLGIVVSDIAGNLGKAAINLYTNASGIVSFDLLATLYGETLTTYSSGSNFLFLTGDLEEVLDEEVGTGQQQPILEKLKEELNNFVLCKNDIDYKIIKIQLKGNEIVLRMPEFRHSQIKDLVNAFVLYTLKQLDNSSLNQDDFEHIGRRFNDFLVILKLIRDDDNVCKQNLSNYHLTQFQESLELYEINF